MRPEVSIMPGKAAVAIEPRRVLTRRETIELAVRQGGRCGCPCREKLNALTEGVTDEHVIPLAKGGTNDLSNRELWRTPCAIQKTKGDRSDDASVKRIEARQNGTRRERQKIPGAKLQSGGFGGGPSKRQQRMAERQQGVTDEPDSDDGNEGEAVVTPKRAA